MSVVPVVPGEGVGVGIEGEEGGCREGEGVGMEGEGGWDEEEVGTWSTVVEGNLGWGRGERGEGEMTTHIRGNEQHLEKPSKTM